MDHLREYERAGRGARVAFIHGDPVFSNILLTAANDVYFIDMRGRLGDTLTTAGDVLYDLAKVYQSLCGYDDIMLGSGLASDSGGKMQEDYLRKLRTEFRAHVRASPFYSSKLQLPAGLRDLEIITASLFFSLIPLHDEGAKIARYVEKCRMLIFSGTENAYDE